MNTFILIIYFNLFNILLFYYFNNVGRWPKRAGCSSSMQLPLPTGTACAVSQSFTKSSCSGPACGPILHFIAVLVKWQQWVYGFWHHHADLLCIESGQKLWEFAALYACSVRCLHELCNISLIEYAVTVVTAGLLQGSSVFITIMALITDCSGCVLGSGVGRYVGFVPGGVGIRSETAL